MNLRERIPAKMKEKLFCHILLNRVAISFKDDTKEDKKVEFIGCDVIEVFVVV